MPTSDFRHIPAIMSAIGGLCPRSVLDVGCGYGKYGFLVRELLTHQKHTNPKIDAIEVFPSYIGPLQRAVYDEIFIGEAIEVLSSLPSKSYDMVLAIDILEHFTFERGTAFLDQIKRVGLRSIVCTPKLTLDQGDIAGNPYEVHRSEWTPKQIGADDVVSDDRAHIAIIGAKLPRKSNLMIKLTRVGMRCKRQFIPYVREP